MKSISEHFIGPYNHRAIWLYTRNLDFCAEGETGKNEIEIPEPVEKQEITIDTLPKINAFDDAVRKANENVKSNQLPNLLEQIGKNG